MSKTRISLPVEPISPTFSRLTKPGYAVVSLEDLQKFTRTLRKARGGRNTEPSACLILDAYVLYSRNTGKLQVSLSLRAS